MYTQRKGLILGLQIPTLIIQDNQQKNQGTILTSSIQSLWEQGHFLILCIVTKTPKFNFKKLEKAEQTGFGSAKYIEARMGNSMRVEEGGWPNMWKGKIPCRDREWWIVTNSTLLNKWVNGQGKGNKVKGRWVGGWPLNTGLSSLDFQN